MTTKTIEHISYIQALGSHITEYLHDKWGSASKEKFDAYMEKATTIPMFKELTPDTMLVYRLRYNAIFHIEDMPTDKINPHVVNSRVLAWINDFDHERDKHGLRHPEIEIDAYNNGTLADVEIDIEFVESITARRLPEGRKGDITYQGSEWSISPYVILTAEEFEVLPHESPAPS